jgi:L,D-transpeptidase catalytic domain
VILHAELLLFSARHMLTKTIVSLALMSTLVASALANEHLTINLKEQRLYLYRDGHATFTTQLSTGRRGMPTPRGEYAVSDKDQHHISTIYNCPMPTAVQNNC